MSDPGTLRIGTFPYDTTRALFDGSVTLDGQAATFTSARTLPEIFRGLTRADGYDIAEFGLTFYLRSLDEGVPFTAVPAFPNRVFRHSCVFVHRDSGITGPEDLVDRTIGEFGVYGQDSGVWAKGILMDEYGFRPQRNRWVIGGLDTPDAPFDFVRQVRPAGVDIRDAPAGRSLSGMLRAGEIDALFTANVPQPVLDGAPEIVRLFPDHEERERDYHRRTGIFPIMHTVVAPRELLDARPGLATRVYNAFLRAKDAAADRYRQGRRLYEVHSMVPWTAALVERNRAQFAEDWFPYGVSANRSALDTYLRYHHEQGLSAAPDGGGTVPPGTAGHLITGEHVMGPEERSGPCRTEVPRACGRRCVSRSAFPST
jgi:4,5-dihydroxyphthalate decarboxylase